MLRRQQQIRTRLHEFTDAGLFSLSFWLAHQVRAASGIEIFGGTAQIQPFEDYFWLLILVFPFSPLILQAQGFYGRPLMASRMTTAWQLMWGCIWLTAFLVFVLFLTREQLARSVIILSGVISFVVVFLKEELTRRWMQSKMGQAQFRKRLVLVGSAEDTARLRGELVRNARYDVEILGELDLNQNPVMRLVELLHEHSANGVVVTGTHLFFGEIEKTIQACELEGVEVWLLADFFKTQISQTTLDDFYGRPMLVFRSAPEASWQGLAKQVMDFFGALGLLILASPLLVTVVALIKLTSKGPVLFKQQRSGLNGRPFTMLKFRSMVTDAEQRQDELAALNEMSGPVFKIANDPRITPVGRYLRRYSIDELPQLINVVCGEMSLVGPRPLPVHEVKRFDDLSHRRRLSVKPGLTCLWQISGRNEVRDFKDWVRLDLEYIDNWSFWLDLKILIRTIPVVFAGTGAR